MGLTFFFFCPVDLLTCGAIGWYVTSASVLGPTNTTGGRVARTIGCLRSRVSDDDGEMLSWLLTLGAEKFLKSAAPLAWNASIPNVKVVADARTGQPL